MTSVKRSFFRHPAVVAMGSAALVALLGLNALAFARGLEAPWLLGAVIIADMLVIGLGILFAAREVLLADSRTEASKAQLEAIVDSAMDAIITIDAAQNIVLFNRAAEQIFRCGRREALGGPLDRFLPQRFRAAHRGHIEHFARTGVTSRKMGDVTTLWGLRADGEEFPLEASISQAGATGEHYYTVILRDITLRRQAEADAERARGALDEAQRRLGAIVDSAMDAVLTVDEEQKIVLFNRAAEQVFGVRREAMIGTPLDRLLPARFRGAHRGHIEGFGRTGVTSRRMGDVTTLWALRGDNSEEFPIEASISQALEGGKRYYTVILRDITLRKQAEDALRESQRELRQLSARVQEAREEEKAHIARELHDELGQLLTALKMDLGWVRERLPRETEVASRLNEMSGLLDRTVGATRRISADLRPLMLDDLGLADAAAWLVDDFAKRSGVASRIDLPPELPEISKAVGTAVYRAVQESLTNIARHAGAKSAWVVMAVEDGALHVEVEDDGRGIAPEDLAKARSLGLKGMRERIAFLGGALEIARAPRGGTRLRLTVPLRGLAQENAA
ncbi:MAG TPA: PAS domain S-box protein [Burkholderiales bacterium]|nr:PAS domain S-box protein [Burkholderiales bacterium]